MSDDELRPVGLVLVELLATVDPLGPASLAIERAAGHVLFTEVRATTDLPRFDNAAMDGIAVRAADTAGAMDAHPVRLELVGAAYAGTRDQLPTVGHGAAARIATGAPLPPGADAVVRVERTTAADGAVLAHTEVRRGADVRRRGEDVHAGDVLLPRGALLGPGQIAAAAGGGHHVVEVHRAPKVAVLLTGDEVVAAGPSARLGAHQVHDAVGPALVTLLTDAGAAAVSIHGPAGDEPETLRKTLETLAEETDLLITVGGVSRGERDLVPGAIAALGAVSVGGVALKPGKPFRHGTVGTTPVLCLPGNPAAALVTAEVFGRPVITRMAGGGVTARAPRRGVLTEPIEQRPGRIHWIRAVVEEGADGRRVRPSGSQGASMLHSLAAANAWLVLAPEVTRVDAGDEVDVIPMWGDRGRASWRPT